MAGFGRFLVLAHLFLSVMFMGTGFALWYYRVDLTNSAAKQDQPAGLYYVEKQTLDVKQDAFRPKIRIYEGSLNRVENQESALIKDRQFYEDEIAHVANGAKMGDFVRRYSPTVNLLDLGIKPVKDIPEMQPRKPLDPTDPLTKELDLVSIKESRDNLTEESKKFRERTKELQELIRDEIVATVNLIGTNRTLTLINAKIDEVQNGSKDPTVLATLEALRKEMAETEQQDPDDPTKTIFVPRDSKGIRERIVGERAKKKILDTEIEDIIPKIKLVENKKQIFDESEEKLQSRLVELNEKTAREKMMEKIAQEEALIRKLEQEISDLELRLLLRSQK